jgi:hypothetical protein
VAVSNLRQGEIWAVCEDPGSQNGNADALLAYAFISGIRLLSFAKDF